MTKKIIVGIMGPGSDATDWEKETAEQIGAIIAENGWWILTGGSPNGVMHHGLKGGKELNPHIVTIGILSHDGSDPTKTSEYVDLPIPTGMGEGRNYLNVKSCDILVFCCNNVQSSPGTYSELVFAIKHKKPIICFHQDKQNSKKPYRAIYTNIINGFDEKYYNDDQVITDDIKELIGTLQNMAAKILGR